jgi:response regulator RpfG family c-di-GMP phosphodiesterase
MSDQNRSKQILCVDDDPNLLASLKRTLRKEFDLALAGSGTEALEVVSGNGRFAVILADMRMPGMDGVELLKRVKQISPDTVRVMLTGNADLSTAVEAVNQGHIFRFLTKPCSKDDLLNSLTSAVRQHELIVAERQLLEETLKGSLGMTVDILSMVNPVAFGRARRVLAYVRYVVGTLSLPDPWRYDVAAMLSQLGCVSLQPELLEKVFAGQELSDDERARYASHPELGGRLVSRIPRLEIVGEMVSRQEDPVSRHDRDKPVEQRDEAEIGGEILKVCLDYDRLIAHGMTADMAVDVLRKYPDTYEQRLVEILTGHPAQEKTRSVRVVDVSDMTYGMILDQDVCAKKGQLLATRGQEVTVAMLAHLKRWNDGPGVDQPIRVIDD